MASNIGINKLQLKMKLLEASMEERQQHYMEYFLQSDSEQQHRNEPE